MLGSNRLLTALQLVFKIRPGEGYRVAVMFGYSLAAIGGVIIIGRSVGRILFLSQLPETFVPYKFILPPLFVVLTTAVYTQLATRFRLPRLIEGLSLLMMGGVLIFRYLLETAMADSFALLAALYVTIEIMASLVGIQFWTFAADIFDARQAKRLFGLIAAGGVIANILAGIGLQAAAAVIAPKDLLFAVVISLIGCAGAVFALEKQQEETSVTQLPVSQQPASNLRQDLQSVRRTPLLVSIGSIMIIMSLVTNIADYQLDLSLQRFFSADGSGMLTFLGQFQIVTGALALGVQLFATNRLMERFGLVTSLLILPASIALGSGLILVTGGILLAAAWPRGSDVVFRYTVNDAALNTLFLPIQPGLRRRAKAILDGIVKPPIVGLLGLIFLLFGGDGSGVQASTIVSWSVPVLLLTAGWIFLVQRVRSQYRTALADSLRRRRLDLEATEIDVSDEMTIQVLVQSLQDPDEFQVVHALNLMSHAPDVDWLPYIAPHVNHPSQAVRLMVLHLLQASRRPEFADLIASQFTAVEAQVRAAAIEAYCALQEDAAIETVVTFLEEENTQIRGAAIVGLTRYGGLDGMLQAANHLKEMLVAESVEMRCLGAQVLGHLGVQNFYRPLLPLLADPVLQVQVAAMRAAGQLRHPAFVPYLITGLGRPGTATVATDALVAYGPGIEKVLAGAFNDGVRLAVRLQIPKVLQQIHTANSAQLLLAHVEEKNDHMRGRVLQALTRLQSQGMVVKVSEQYLQEMLLREVRQYYELFVIYDDLGESGRGVLLEDTLRTQMQYTMERLFYLFGLLYPAQNVRQMQQGLAQGDTRLRANAIELLDTMATREVKELVLPLIEAEQATLLSIAHTQLHIPARSLEERLAELARYSSGWLRACVLFQIGLLRLQALAHLVMAGLEAEELIVRETAVYASQYLLSPAEYRAVLQRETADSANGVARYAQQLLQELTVLQDL
jgi:hypothetical protein